MIQIPTPTMGKWVTEAELEQVDREREEKAKLCVLLSDKEIWALVMAQYPRTEKEKEGCLTEMQRMYDLRRLYKYELIELNEQGKFDKNETIR